MDQLELQDWCDLCEGRKVFAPDHFSQIFMESFANTLSEKDQNDIIKVFSYVPNSAKTLEKVLRIGRFDSTAVNNDNDVIDFIAHEMQTTRSLIGDPRVIEIIDNGRCEITTDEERFDQAVDSEFTCVYRQAACDYIIAGIHSLADQKLRSMIRSLYWAFYGISNDLQLQNALTANLIGCPVQFDNYFELYLSGVDYALDECGALAFRRR